MSATETYQPPGVSTLSSEESAGVEYAVRNMLSNAPDRVDSPEWVERARNTWEEFPASVRCSLRNFRRDSGPEGSILFRGLPVGTEPLPPTPNTAASVQRTPSVGSAVLLSFASGLGDPAAFLPEKGGSLVQDVVPVPGKEDFQGNAGSVLLNFHNENAFHPHRPDFILLLCLRSDPAREAGLRTACVRTVLGLLSASARTALESPEFVTEPPPSFGGADGDDEPHPVVFGDRDDPDLRVDLSATAPLSDRAAEALSELKGHFASTAQTLYLESGDLAIVDNRVAVHGRTAFRPAYDGNDRWLQRTFAFADLRRSRAWRAGDGYVMTV